MQTHRVRALLMGGQACVFYGAMEFSRDVDLANLERFQNALADLRAVSRQSHWAPFRPA